MKLQCTCISDSDYKCVSFSIGVQTVRLTVERPMQQIALFNKLREEFGLSFRFKLDETSGTLEYFRVKDNMEKAKPRCHAIARAEARTMLQYMPHGHN